MDGARAVDGVRLERTGWRDAWISERHRIWGYDCPMVDIDFLAVEYNRAVPVALCEYKAREPYRIDLQSASLRALANAANGMGVPFFVTFYRSHPVAFCVLPVNKQAQKHFRFYERLSEREYVSRLYTLRGITMPSAVAERLDNRRPVSPEGTTYEPA